VQGSVDIRHAELRRCNGCARDHGAGDVPDRSVKRTGDGLGDYGRNIEQNEKGRDEQRANGERSSWLQGAEHRTAQSRLILHDPSAIQSS
jgi:hypothetical protein